MVSSLTRFMQHSRPCSSNCEIVHRSTARLTRQAAMQRTQFSSPQFSSPQFSSPQFSSPDSARLIQLSPI
eukprot:365408-Chlamydomonas_euryale.AAC.13